MSSIKKFVVYTIAVLILPLAVSSESLPDDAKPVRALGIFWIGVSKENILDTAYLNGIRLADANTNESLEYEFGSSHAIPEQNFISAFPKSLAETTKEKIWRAKEYFPIHNAVLVFENGKLLCIAERLSSIYPLDTSDTRMYSEMVKKAKDYMVRYRAFHGGFSQIRETDTTISIENNDVVVFILKGTAVSNYRTVDLTSGTPMWRSEVCIHIERKKSGDQ
ncbi:MAG: hypothetical protein AB2L13_19475 [Spirochaetota bacterium]